MRRSTGNTRVRRDRIRGAFEEYRDILTLDGMVDFGVFKDGDFEIVFDNHHVVEISDDTSRFVPIAEAQFVFNRAYSPRYLHYHVHSVNLPEDFDERVEQLKWNRSCVDQGERRRAGALTPGDALQHLGEQPPHDSRGEIERLDAGPLA
jgi:hypothetical protein